MTLDARLLRIPNVMLSSPEVVCSGQPDAPGLESARAAGIRYVINLRPKAEEPSFDTEAAVRALGMSYLALPIAGATDFTQANIKAFDALLQRIGAEPVLIHCASGNRVGALMALRARWIEGKPVDEAMSIGTRSGLTKMSEVVRPLLEVAPD
jgi:uncharacterized protein (TIGR01244 family)